MFKLGSMCIAAAPQDINRTMGGMGHLIQEVHRLSIGEILIHNIPLLIVLAVLIGTATFLVLRFLRIRNVIKPEAGLKAENESDGKMRRALS